MVCTNISLRSLRRSAVSAFLWTDTQRDPAACRNRCRMSVARALLRRDHLRDPADAGVARVEIPLRIHCHVAGFDELSFPSPGSVADRPEDVAVPVDLEDLPVLSGRQPELSVRADVERALQVSHLDRLDELSVRVVDEEPVFLAIADVDVAVGGIDRDAMDHAEVSLAGVVAEPLVDEFAVLVEVQNPRGAALVRR